ncbi:MAG: hydroxysqualene dehydroxylase HpnE [Vicinamibacterales bacterium]
MNGSLGRDDAANSADVVVIGAGFAGLSAAVRLAGAGLKVVVLEEAPRLGGRASAFTDRVTGERVDNGQHVIFGCYRETYAFLREIGTASLAPLQPQLRLVVANGDGPPRELLCPSLPAPWHLLAGVLSWRGLPLRDRLSALRLGRFLIDARRRGPRAAAAAVADVAGDQTVTQWLTARGQSAALREWLWDPLAIAALNQSADTAGVEPFARVLAELFGPSRQDAGIGLATVPLDELFARPAAAYIEARGGQVHLRAPARVRLDARGHVRGVDVGGVTVATRLVIGAVPWHAVDRLWDDAIPAELDTLVSDAARMKSSPIVTVNLWLANAILPATFVGLLNGPMHWVFDKSAIFGQQAGHLSVVASGATRLVGLDNEAITRAALEHVRAALPALRHCDLRRSVVVREQRATFSLEPGRPRRPGAVTRLEGFLLAGDWTDTGLPATIEGAVQSGHLAADLALRRLGRPPRGTPASDRSVAS